jgi:hypothetical protein
VRDRRRRGEEGTIAVLVATLLGTGVFFGLMALVFDFGIVNWNHSQLQSASEAAALQAAKICATSTTGCPAASVVEPIARANDDGSRYRSHVDLCGNKSPLPGCGPNDNNRITSCPDVLSLLPPGANGYVKARAQKDTDHTFGRAGKAQGQACAAAAWGPLAPHSATLPITFSVCEWQAYVGGDPLSGSGGTYAPPPPYPPNPANSFEHKIPLESKTQGACTTFNGHDAPGGFGWLTSGSGCTSTVTTGGWVQVDTGVGTPSGCDAQIRAALRTVIQVPVYDCMNSTATMPANPATQCSTGNGTHLYYHIAGYAGFYVTGFQLAGSQQVSVTSGRQLCGSGEKCIQGYFVKSVVGGDIGGGGTADFGLKAIKTIG